MSGIMGKKYRGTSRAISFLLVLCLVLTCFMSVPMVSNADAASDAAVIANNGLNLSSLTTTPGIVLGGDGITNGMGFKGDYYFLSESNINKLRTGAVTSSELGLGASSWFEDVVYSAYDDHTVGGNYYYFPISGIDLKSAASALGITASNMDITAYGSDGYIRTLSSAFSDRYAYASGATTSSTVVQPALALQTGASGGTTANTNCQTVVFGQNAANEVTHCNWVSSTGKVRFGTENTAALSIYTVSADTKAYSIADLVNMGVYQTSYSYYASGSTTLNTHNLTGVPLSVVLSRAGITVTADQKIVTGTTDNYPKTIPYSDLSKWFVAYDGYDSDGTHLSNNSSLRMYGPGTYGTDVVVKHLNSLKIQSTSATATTGGAVTTSSGVGITKAAFTSTDDISNEVFFIALQSTTGAAVKYYYYTKADLEAYETTQLFSYDDHTVDKNVTAKGAKLSALLKDLDTAAGGDLQIQYLEADGYHAATSQAVSYQDKVSWLTNSHAVTVSETYSPMNTMITYGINEQYVSPDANNVNDPAGIFKDADNSSGYLRAYRDRGDANSTVLKYLVGVAISPSGTLANANTGFTLQAQDTTGTALTFSADVTTTIKGLITGMKYSVKAPKVVGASLKSGEAAKQIVTVGTGTSTPVTFTYTENPYFYVKNGNQTINYTFSQLKTLGQQVPTAMTPTPYGYSSPMYYRYNGMWLSALLSGYSDIQAVKFVSTTGAITRVPVANINKYFIAYNNTESKSSTNTPESKRVTKNYDDAKVIVPSDGTAVNASSAGIGADVSVLLAQSEGVIVTTDKDAYSGTEDISDEVFFIALQPTAGAAVKYYYYTQQDLEDYETTQLFSYDDHTVDKNVTAKGALLSEILKDLDTAAGGDLMIQYLEADGYHAATSQAVSYQDKVSWLTAAHAVTVSETYDPMNTMITYGINEQYVSPDANNVNDPTGVYKDADNNSGYLRAYRNRGDANSTVLKYLVGVAISPTGTLANANTGFTLKAQDASGTALSFSADVTTTIKGLITGMKYSAKAPKVVGASLKSGEAACQIVTVGTGTSTRFDGLQLYPAGQIKRDPARVAAIAFHLKIWPE